MKTQTNHGSEIPLPSWIDTTPAPDWVIEYLADRNTDNVLAGLGSGFVRMRDGVVIDRWSPKYLRSGVL